MAADYRFIHSTNNIIIYSCRILYRNTESTLSGKHTQVSHLHILINKLFHNMNCRIYFEIYQYIKLRKQDDTILRNKDTSKLSCYILLVSRTKNIVKLKFSPAYRYIG